MNIELNIYLSIYHLPIFIVRSLITFSLLPSIPTPFRNMIHTGPRLDSTTPLPLLLVSCMQINLISLSLSFLISKIP
jgi:hypothetical protein